MRRIEPLLVLLLLAAGLALRWVAASADPPGWLSWSAGIFSDEGIYAEDARLWVLYGQHMQGDFHAAAAAPLQNLLLLWAFRRFGATLVVLRHLTALCAVASLAAFWAALRAGFGRRTALVGLLLLTVSAPLVLYNRLGLLETPALLWLALGYLALSAAGSGRAAAGMTTRATLLTIAGALLAVATAWKATFALATLPLLVYAVWRYGWLAAGSVTSFATTGPLYWAALVRPREDEVARLDRYYLLHQYLPHSATGVAHDLARGLWTGAGDGVLPYLLHYGGLLWLPALWAGWRALTGRGARASGAAAADLAGPDAGEYDRHPGADEAALWAWLLTPLAAMLAMSYTPSRYFLIFWPALAALAARGLTRGDSGERVPRRLPAAVAGIGLGALVAWNLVMLYGAWSGRTYTERQDAAVLQRVLPERAWLAGQFAPTICMDCRLRSLYVQRGLANDGEEPLATLPITHVLATRVADPADDPWRGRYDAMIPDPAGLGPLPVGRRFTVRVYANRFALP